LTRGKSSVKYFDKKNRRLIFFKEKATADFWDKHWASIRSSGTDISAIKSTWASRFVQEYIDPSEGVILEGGCGNAEHVSALVNNGYNVVGIDNAEKTVETLKEHFPYLDIRKADVRRIPFENGFFRAYLSLGVIEHFRDGYERVLDEMYRVMEEGGYLFLAVPYMSPLRRIKALLGCYCYWSGDVIPESFYQFALDYRNVIRDVENKGFRLVKVSPFDMASGVELELSPGKAGFINKLLKYPGKNIFVRFFRKMIYLFLKHSANHTVMMVFRK
jgi:SAM-dependent methyltransferase